MTEAMTVSWSALDDERSHRTERALLFELGGAQYAMSVDFVQRVIELQDITPVPGAQPWIAGVVVHELQPYSLIDPRFFLRPDLTDHRDELRRAVIIKSAHGNVLLGVEQLITISELKTRPHIDIARAEFPARFIEYTCRSDETLIGVINVAELLQAAAESAAQASGSAVTSGQFS
ncbi:MAG: chemotaxis protein CheW [Pseudomonadota bacterium]